jgi:hypothetical protein
VMALGDAHSFAQEAWSATLGPVSVHSAASGVTGKEGLHVPTLSSRGVSWSISTVVVSQAYFLMPWPKVHILFSQHESGAHIPEACDGALQGRGAAIVLSPLRVYCFRAASRSVLLCIRPFYVSSVQFWFHEPYLFLSLNN